MQLRERSTEHPFMKPYWMMYAQYEGRKVVLIDYEAQNQYTKQIHSNDARYLVVIGPFPCSTPIKCLHPNREHGRKIWSGNDPEIARIKFEQSADILRESGFDILF